MKKNILALTVLLGVAATSANAAVYIDNSIDGDKAKKVITQSHIEIKKIKTVVSQIGNKEQKLAFIKGFAKDIPLKVALDQIIPQDWSWKYLKSDSLDLTKKVSWKGGKTWLDIFEKLSEDNFSATINWFTKSILIKPINFSHIDELDGLPITYHKVVKGDPKGGSEKAVVGKATCKVSKHCEKTYVAKEAKTKEQKDIKAPVAKDDKSKAKDIVVAKKATPTPPKVEKWLLTRDKTLKENLTEWAERAGWVLSWNAPDYKVLNNIVYYGKIDSPDSPFIAVVKSYQNSQFPLKVIVAGGNKVIAIEARNYKTGVVDLNPTNSYFSN